MTENDPLILKCLEIYKKTKFKYRITDYLKSIGYEEQQAEPILQKVLEIYNSERAAYLKKRNLGIWIGCLLLFILVSYLFYSVVPKTSMRNSPFITSALGAGILMVIIYHLIALFNTWSEDYIQTLLKNNSEIRINYSFLYFMLLPAIVPYFIFNSRYKDEIETHLVQDGIKTEAIVENGWSQQLPGRRGRSMELFYIMVSFKDANGKKLEATKEVSQREFNNFYKGQKVMIVYDKNNLDKIEILTNSENIKKFTNSEERVLSPNDLFYLLKVESNDSVLNYLNQTSLGWERRKGKYVNDRRFEMIEKSEESIGYVSGQSFKEVQKTYKELGFELIDEKKYNHPAVAAISKLEVYAKDTYIVQIEQKAVANKEYTTKLMTIINVLSIEK